MPPILSVWLCGRLIHPDVICEYVYWDKEAKEKTFYQPGDFERLFSESKKIKLFYKDGANLLEIATLPSLIKNLEEKHPGCKLSFQSIEETSGGAIATLVLEESKDIAVEEIEAIRAVIQAEAEHNINALRLALESKDKDIAELQIEVKTLDRVIDKFIKKAGKTIMGDAYKISGQAGAVGPNAHAHDNTFNQLVNQINQSIDLSALAKELSELHQAIKDKQDSSPQADIALVKVAEAEIAACEKDTAKVVEHLKAAGKWTMDFAKEIGKDVVAEAIKQAMQGHSVFVSLTPCFSSVPT